MNGLRILVAEDEFLPALLMEETLREAGCIVVGPFARVSEALRAAEEEKLDGAILDINLGGESVLVVAEVLLERGVPIAFCSGYADASALPMRFSACPYLSTPVLPDDVRAVLGGRVARRRAAGESAMASALL
jgi:CheY-like chemotaxis protein